MSNTDHKLPKGWVVSWQELGGRFGYSIEAPDQAPYVSAYRWGSWATALAAGNQDARASVADTGGLEPLSGHGTLLQQRAQRRAVQAFSDAARAASKGEFDRARMDAAEALRELAAAQGAPAREAYRRTR